MGTFKMSQVPSRFVKTIVFQRLLSVV